MEILLLDHLLLCCFRANVDINENHRHWSSQRVDRLWTTDKHFRLSWPFSPR